MSNATARRGRPKGTGLDDRARLKAVAAILASNPDLKTTTAIKVAGVSDPSTIRRLRDKFQECRAELMAEVRGPRPKSLSAAAVPAATSEHHTAPRSAVPAEPRETAQHQSNLPAVLPAARVDQAPVPAQGWATSALDANPWLAAWCAWQVKAASTVLDAQLGMLNELMKMPSVNMALRQHVEINRLAMQFCAPPRVRQLLH